MVFYKKLSRNDTIFLNRKNPLWIPSTIRQLLLLLKLTAVNKGNTCSFEGFYFDCFTFLKGHNIYLSIYLDPPQYHKWSEF